MSYQQQIVGATFLARPEERPNSAWSHGVFLGEQLLRLCICTDASRGLSATAEFL